MLKTYYRCDQCGRTYDNVPGKVRCPDCVDSTFTVLQEQPKQALLAIELQDETSVPRVFYKGEEVTHKIHVSFDWDTDTDQPLEGGLTMPLSAWR